MLSVIRTEYASTSDADEVLHLTAPSGDTTRIKTDSPEVWSGTAISVMPATTVPERNPCEINDWPEPNWEGYSSGAVLPICLLLDSVFVVAMELDEGEEWIGTIYSESCHNDVWCRIVESSTHFYMPSDEGDFNKLMRHAKEEAPNRDIRQVAMHFLLKSQQRSLISRRMFSRRRRLHPFGDDIILSSISRPATQQTWIAHVVSQEIVSYIHTVS